jgi:broad specificity phosphatase PhoE
MSTLFLVRHGQASFGSDNYDQLSPLGIQQASHLRDHFVENSVELHGICSGRLQRQRSTAEILASTSQRPVAVSAAFDEYDAHRLMQHYAHMTGEPLQSLQGTTGRLDPRSFQQHLEKVSRAWVDEQVSAPDLESWKNFRARVGHGIDEITTTTPRSQNVAVATSAGVIGVAIAHVLGLDDLAALQLSYVVLNSAVTRIEFDGTRRTLASFNSTAHLERAGRRELLTYL